MRHLILSDLHLGDPRFHKDAELLQVLRSEEYDSLVLAGDIYDAWAEGKVGYVIARHRGLIEKLRKISDAKKVLWIVGNHEETIGDWHVVAAKILPEAVFLERLELGDTLLIHGHQIERKTSWLLNRIGTWLNLLMYRLFGTDPQEAFRRLGSWYPWHCRVQQRAYVHEELSSKFARLVLGHTHLPGQFFANGVEVTDLGDWVYHSTYAMMTEEKVLLKGGWS